VARVARTRESTYERRIAKEEEPEPDTKGKRKRERFVWSRESGGGVPGHWMYASTHAKTKAPRRAFSIGSLGRFSPVLIAGESSYSL